METITRKKGQPMEWEQILASCVLKKGLVCNIYKELLKLNSKSKQNRRPF
jgi:hypothetical protein